MLSGFIMLQCLTAYSRGSDQSHCSAWDEDSLLTGAERSRGTPSKHHMSLDGVPLLLRPGRGKADLLWGCVRRLVSWVKGSMSELRSVTLTSHSLTFSPRAHCWASSWSTWRRSLRSVLLPSTMTVTWGHSGHTIQTLSLTNIIRKLLFKPSISVGFKFWRVFLFPKSRHNKMLMLVNFEKKWLQHKT